MDENKAQGSEHLLEVKNRKHALNKNLELIRNLKWSQTDSDLDHDELKLPYI